MGLSAILEAIYLSGEQQVEEIERSSADEIVELLRKSRSLARKLKEDASAKEVIPAYRERARILHRARLESLRITGNARESLIDETLERARGHLAGLRSDSIYPVVLHNLVQETLTELDETLEDIRCSQLEADLRDKVMLEKIVGDLTLDITISYDLQCWGGLVAKSCDGRVIIINTLEARFDRAVPFLRRYLATVFENLGLDNAVSRRTERAVVYT